MRLFEVIFYGHLYRNASKKAITFFCWLFLCIIGVSLTRPKGFPTEKGLIVSNHTSWLDIVVLWAALGAPRVLSKSEVARWPLIGLLSRLTGTLFTDRRPKNVRTQLKEIAQVIKSDQQVIIFPEGTSSDGLRVLPFKSSFLALAKAKDLALEKVTLVCVYYVPPRKTECPPYFYGWWGKIEFGVHFLRVLSAPLGGQASPEDTRKTLAEKSEQRIRDYLLKHNPNAINALSNQRASL